MINRIIEKIVESIIDHVSFAYGVRSAVTPKKSPLI